MEATYVKDQNEPKRLTRSVSNHNEPIEAEEATSQMEATYVKDQNDEAQSPSLEKPNRKTGSVESKEKTVKDRNETETTMEVDDQSVDEDEAPVAEALAADTKAPHDTEIDKPDEQEKEAAP